MIVTWISKLSTFYLIKIKIVLRSHYYPCLGQLLRLHVPDIELLPDPSHCILVLLGEDEAAGDPGLLVHIPDIVREEEVLCLYQGYL